MRTPGASRSVRMSSSGNSAGISANRFVGPAIVIPRPGVPTRPPVPPRTPRRRPGDGAAPGSFLGDELIQDEPSSRAGLGGELRGPLPARGGMAEPEVAPLQLIDA